MTCESSRNDNDEELQLSPAVTTTFLLLSAALLLLSAAGLACRCRAKAEALAAEKLFFTGLLFWVRSISLSRSGRPRTNLLCRQPSHWPACISVRE